NLALHAEHRLAVRNVGNEGPEPHDVGERPARLSQDRREGRVDVARLLCRTLRHRHLGVIVAGGAGDQNLVVRDDRARIAVCLLERRAGQEAAAPARLAHANSMIAASTASESPSLHRIALTVASRSALSTFSIFIASTMQSCSPALTSCPTLTAIALTRPGIGQSRVFEPSTPFRSIISAASCASRRV